MEYGIPLGVSEAIASTNFNDIENITIWRHVDVIGLCHSIVVSIWEYNGAPEDLPEPSGAIDLRPHDGRCHSFQYRVEEPLEADDPYDDADPDDLELIDSEEDICVELLVQFVPSDVKTEAAEAVRQWRDESGVPSVLGDVFA